jgi:hypothetical protein
MPTYGPELITNGGFDTDLSGWTLSPATPERWVWNNGRAHHQYEPTDIVELRQSIGPLVKGELYEISVTVDYIRSTGDAAQLRMYFKTAAGTIVNTATWIDANDDGTFVGLFRTPYVYDIAIVGFALASAFRAEWYLDDISIRQVTPDTANPDLPDVCTGTIVPPGGSDSEFCPNVTWDSSGTGCGTSADPTWEDPCEEPV